MHSSIFLRFEQWWVPTGRCDKIVSDIPFHFLWLHIFHAVIRFRILLFEAFLTSKNPDSGISLYRLIPQGFYMISLASSIVHIPFAIFTVYSLVFDYFYFPRLYQPTSLILTHQLAYHFLTHNVLCGHP